MADHVSTLLVVTGPADDLRRFGERHTAGGTFDFNTVVPMPPSLEIKSDSSVETGYAALYGNWQEVAGYWMFKEPAAAFGYPFPLQSREQVVACLRSFDCADMYLAPAEQYHRNVIEHGHGDWYGWCQQHWGTKWNADDVSIEASDSAIAIRFVTAGKYPRPILKVLSTSFPSLHFHVRHVDEYLRRGKDFVLVKGREIRKNARTATAIAEEIHGRQA
jgi:hypothetical protein